MLFLSWPAFHTGMRDTPEVEDLRESDDLSRLTEAAGFGVVIMGGEDVCRCSLKRPLGFGGTLGGGNFVFLMAIGSEPSRLRILPAAVPQLETGVDLPDRLWL